MKAKVPAPNKAPSPFDWKSTSSSVLSSNKRAHEEQERANRTAIKRIAATGGDPIKSGAPYRGK